MSIGLSLFAIMVGAILKFAVTAQLAGISLSTVGVILMVVVSVANATTIAPIVAPTNGMKSKKPTTRPSASA